MERLAIGSQRASAWVRLALANVTREFPNKLDHLLIAPEDVRTPRALHPVFYGSYDWHSSVHMHWLLVRLARLYPGMREADQVAEHFDRQFAPEAMALEAEYLAHPARRTFERTYGWAWLLKLALELALLADAFAPARRWRAALDPLAQAVVARYLEYLPRADYPIRAGTHANSAFGLLFALEYARASTNASLAEVTEQKALRWFGDDCAYPARLEPCGSDFLSGGLQEAVLLHCVLGDAQFGPWWQRFEPAEDEWTHWLTPVVVSDRRDAQMIHLDGLNLSRAWCWARLQRALPPERAETVAAAIRAHLEASLPQAGGGDYVGTHWLASFATLALSG